MRTDATACATCAARAITSPNAERDNHTIDAVRYAIEPLIRANRVTVMTKAEWGIDGRG